MSDFDLVYGDIKKKLPTPHNNFIIAFNPTGANMFYKRFWENAEREDKKR